MKTSLDVARKYVGVLQEVKPVDLLPNLNYMPLKSVALYLGIKESTLYNWCCNHKREMKDLGVVSLNYNDFVEVGYYLKEQIKGSRIMGFDSFEIKIANLGIRCFTQEAILYLALNVKLLDGYIPAVIEQIRAKVKEKMDKEDRGESLAKIEVLTVREYNEQKEAAAETTLVSERQSSNEIQSFANSKFGVIRTVTIDNEPWFVGKDVAKILGYERATKAVQSHVDKEDIDEVPIRDSIGRMQNTPIINESGLYSLILSSKLPTAKEFKRWVTSEILPSIRKHGAYMTPETIQQAIFNPDFLIQLATNLKAEQEKNRALTETNTSLSKANTSLTITNRALVGEINTWEYRAIINALIRSFAVCCLCGDFRYAYNLFYKNLYYKYHINIRAKADARDGYKDRFAENKKPLINLIEPHEAPAAIMTAAAMCVENDLDVGDIIDHCEPDVREAVYREVFNEAS